MSEASITFQLEELGKKLDKIIEILTYHSTNHLTFSKKKLEENFNEVSGKNERNRRNYDYDNYSP